MRHLFVDGGIWGDMLEPARTRGLISCFAVARAQHLGQNTRFAHCRREAQLGIFCAHHLSQKAKILYARVFLDKTF